MENIMKDLGEGYGYAKTILNHKLSLKKLDLIEDTSGILGILIMALATIISGALVVVILLITIGMIIYDIYESKYMAVSGLMGVAIVLWGLLYYFRQNLIFTPVRRILFSLLSRHI